MENYEKLMLRGVIMGLSEEGIRHISTNFEKKEVHIAFPLGFEEKKLKRIEDLFTSMGFKMKYNFTSMGVENEI